MQSRGREVFQTANCGWPLPPEDEHLSKRDLVGMRDGEERGRAADDGETTGGAAVKLEFRGTAMSDDFHVAPKHALRVTRAERLHGCLFGSKASSEMYR